MAKKAQGLSINVVVIAAIALIVLVIMVLLVIRAGKNTTDAAGDSSCLALGGECMLSCSAQPNYADEDRGDRYCEKNGGIGQSQCCRYKFGG
jgi:hypothetical protein